LNHRYAVVDIETTGGTLQKSRITEIAILVYDGDKIVNEFNSLVNPQETLNPFITKLTGISQEMVDSAPLFEEIADEVLKTFVDTVFVAHNVNYDYSIIKYEFERLDYNFSLPKYCTVRLARKFLPGFKSYSLGRLSSDLGIEINGRHRARGDAEATVKVLGLILQNSNGSLSDPNWKLYDIPDEFDRDLIRQLPESPGIIRIYNSDGKVIEIDSAKDLRKKALGIFKNSKRPLFTRIRKDARFLDFELVQSDLHAEMLRNIERKKNKTTLYRGHYRIPTLYQYQFVEELDSMTQLVLNKSKEINPNYYFFNTQKQAVEAYHSIFSGISVCPVSQEKILGKSIINQKMCEVLGNCVCSGKIDKPVYKKQLQNALKKDFAEVGTFALVESRAKRNSPSFFAFFENNEYVGFGTYDTTSSLDIDSLRSLLNYDQDHLHNEALIRHSYLTGGLKLVDLESVSYS
jgi:DNA polymerase-3 subunit epsilon